MRFNAALLRDRRYLSILLLGFSSGLPLLLVGGTLRYWLADSHVELTLIGIFNLVALPYAFKFVWSPLIDRLALPGLGVRLGQRRSWLLSIQIALAVALLVMARLDPEQSLRAIAAMAVLVAFLSASQDVAIDALRTELLKPDEYAFGIAISTVGYRTAMLAAGAGALYIAQYADWHDAYFAMAALVVIGVIGALLAPERKRPPEPAGSVREWLRQAVWAPLKEFATRRKWYLVLLFIVIYKLGNVLTLSLTSPFYHDMGFTKAEIASITKVFGLAATIAGGFAGVWIVTRIGIWRCLLWGGIGQTIGLYLFWGVAQTGHNLPLLAGAILIENATSAIASTAFVAYISSLCNKQFTATQFALLTSMAALTSETLTSSMGYVGTWLGWSGFFALIPLAALPGLALLLLLRKGFQDVDQQTPAH